MQITRLNGQLAHNVVPGIPSLILSIFVVLEPQMTSLHIFFGIMAYRGTWVHSLNNSLPIVPSKSKFPHLHPFLNIPPTPQSLAHCRCGGYRRRELGPNVGDLHYPRLQPSTQLILHSCFVFPFPFLLLCASPERPERTMIMVFPWFNCLALILQEGP